jgi:hypothetical protein
MKAPGILSVVQRHSLESTYACFKGVTVFLESIENNLQSDEKLIAVSLRCLAEVCERKLVEAFPEMHAWLGEETRGGGR